MAEDTIRVTAQPPFLGEDEVVVSRHRHMAILARLTSLRIAVATLQPLTEGIVNHCVPEDAKVAGRTEGTLLFQRQVTDPPGHVVKIAEEKLLPLFGSVQA